MRKIILLGSTGSIGRQTLEVISSRQNEFDLVGLAAGGANLQLLADQIINFSPVVVALPTNEAMLQLKEILGARKYNNSTITFLAGSQAASELAAWKENTDYVVVLNAITGAAGLEPTLAALHAGHKLALANKESLVIGGDLVTRAAKQNQIVAVDSEHSAFAQALRAGRSAEVRKLILTASGGPFRGKKSHELHDVTAKQALAHPTWNMGRVITINSATLVNKGLELIEAALLYGVDYDQIQVVVHPQSMVHSMVEFFDGSTIAQCSPPDMKLPIGLALTWPNRMKDCGPSFEWREAIKWTFEPLDNDTFPAVELARKAGKCAGTAPAVFNAANESCVDAFCDGKIGFLDISNIIEKCLAEHLGKDHVLDSALNLTAVLAADLWGRQRAKELCKEIR